MRIKETKTAVTKRPIKDKGYSNRVAKARKNSRRMAALERQEKYNSLSYEQKLKLISSRRGDSKREFLRLCENRKAERQ